MCFHFTHRKSDIITIAAITECNWAAILLISFTFVIILLYGYSCFFSGNGYFDFTGRTFTLNLKQKKEGGIDCNMQSHSRAMWPHGGIKPSSGRQWNTQMVFAPWSWTMLLFLCLWLIVSFLFAVFPRLPLHVWPHLSLVPTSSKDLLTPSEQSLPERWSDGPGLGPASTLGI